MRKDISVLDGRASKADIPLEGAFADTPPEQDGPSRISHQGFMGDRRPLLFGLTGLLESRSRWRTKPGQSNARVVFPLKRDGPTPTTFT